MISSSAVERPVGWNACRHTSRPSIPVKRASRFWHALHASTCSAMAFILAAPKAPANRVLNVSLEKHEDMTRSRESCTARLDRDAHSEGDSHGQFEFPDFFPEHFLHFALGHVNPGHLEVDLGCNLSDRNPLNRQQVKRLPCVWRDPQAHPRFGDFQHFEIEGA